MQTDYDLAELDKDVELTEALKKIVRARKQPKPAVQAAAKGGRKGTTEKAKGGRRSAKDKDATAPKPVRRPREKKAKPTIESTDSSEE
jgi:hypothetical protein